MEIPKDVLHSINEMVKKFFVLRKQGKNPELEARIGRLVVDKKRNRQGKSKTVFKPGFGNHPSLIKKFNKSISNIKKSPDKDRWEHSKSIVYIENIFPNNIRSIVMPPQKNVPRSKTSTFTRWQEKIRVCNVDVALTNRIFDIRFSLSVEKDLQITDERVKKNKTKKPDKFKMFTHISNLIKCDFDEHSKLGLRYDVRKIAESETKNMYDVPCDYHIEVEIDNKYTTATIEHSELISKHLILKTLSAVGNFSMKDNQRVRIPDPCLSLRVKQTE